MNLKALAVIACLLIVAWIILRIALAITSGLLHLLWIAAIIMGIAWLWGKVKSRSDKTP